MARRISRWFLDITLDSETLRWWSGTGSVSFGGNTYTGLGDRWTPPDSLKRKASLKSEKIELEFDSSRQSDNSDPVGSLLDEKWRNRAVRLRRLAWGTGDGPDDGDVLEDERGRVRNLSDALEAGSPATITMEIESGAMAYLERRMETRSPASQKRVFAGDLGFDLVAILEGKTLAWRTKHKKAGTVQYELQEEYEPAPREWVLGRFAKTGSFVAAWTHQQQNKSLTRIYAIADHRINKLDKVWINGDLLINTPLVHGTRTEITALRSGGPRAWITFYDGRPGQPSDTFLQSVEPTWTSEHRLRGVAYVIIDHRWDSDLANSYDYRFGGEGALLYDRRKDSTRGGSGAHRWHSPGTWEYSTNAMVAADHYRSGVRIMSGSDAMWFGVGEDPDAVPYAEFEELADHCDEWVLEKGGGYQRRYQVNGVLSADNDHAKNLQKLADQMAARAIDQGGRLSIRPPIVRTPVITLTDGDTIRGTESIADPGGRIDDMVNTLRGTFINPANDYKKDEYPEVAIAAYVDEDNGEISDSLDLPLEISSERSQRIAKLRIEESRRIFELEETYGAKARVIAPGEWFVRESVIRGFPAGKTFIAEEVERYVDGSIKVRACEVDPDQLVWDEETAVDLSEPPSFPQLSLPDIDPPDITVTALELGSGGSLTPGIQIDVSLPADLDDIIADRTEMEYGVSDGASSPGFAGDSFVMDFDPRRETLLFAGFQPSTDYVFRFRGVENRGADGKRYGEWSDFQEVTTTANATATATEVASLADAIVGQGWGATADEDDASNLRAGFAARYGVNFLSGVSGFTTLNITGATASDGVWKLTSSSTQPYIYTPAIDLPGQSMRKVRMRVRCTSAALPSAGWSINFSSELGGYGSNASFSPDGTPSAAQNEWTVLEWTCPSGWLDRTGITGVRFRLGNQSGVDLEVDWIAFGNYSDELLDLRDVEDGADPTGDNTAAAIVDQGALAVLSLLLLGSGYLRREDGVTNLTDALIVTLLGIAAGIEGQGSGATANSLGELNADDQGFLDVARWTNARFSWNFRDSTEDFIATKNVNLSVAAAGGLAVEITGDDPYFTTPTLSIDGSRFTKILVDIENVDVVASAWDNRVFWSAPGHGYGGYSLNARDDSPLAAGERRTLIFDMDEAVADWTADTVDRIRFDFPQTITSGSEMIVHSIRVVAPENAETLRFLNTIFEGADVTGDNTAAAIENQGALAVLSSLAYGGGYLTGFGLLAALSALSLGSPYLTREDETTPLTDALIVTLLGTAAAFTGQDWAATASQLLAGNLYSGYAARYGSNFRDGADGWTASNASLTPAGGRLLLTSSTAQPFLYSPTFSLPGNQMQKIRMRVRCTSGALPGAGWSVNFSSELGGYGSNVSFDADEVPSAAQDQYVILEWTCPAGWVSRTGITGVRFRLGNQSGADLEVDWIAFGNPSDDVLSMRGVEDDADPTLLNTAAAILGQGNQATADAGRGDNASRPASSGSWGFYSNTEVNELQLDVPVSGWVKVADISDPTFRITGKPYLLAEAPGSGGVATTAGAGIIAQNATGTVSYQWFKMSGDAGVSISSSTIANPTFSGTPGAGNALTATYRCIATDGSTSEQTAFDVLVRLTDLL